MSSAILKISGSDRVSDSSSQTSNSGSKAPGLVGDAGNETLGLNASLLSFLFFACSSLFSSNSALLSSLASGVNLGLFDLVEEVTYPLIQDIS